MEKTITNKSDKVLVMTELFDSSPETVFDAWTVKEELVSWYGPEGFTVTFCEMDVRVGGKWRTCIQSPTGEDYWMKGEYIEISRPTKLVFTFGNGSENAKPEEKTLVTINFSKKGNKTEMKFVQTDFPTVASRDSHHGGWSGAFNCLREFLEIHL